MEVYKQLEERITLLEAKTEFYDHGTSAGLLLAEAWKCYAQHLKDVLIQLLEQQFKQRKLVLQALKLEEAAKSHAASSSPPCMDPPGQAPIPLGRLLNGLVGVYGQAKIPSFVTLPASKEEADTVEAEVATWQYLHRDAFEVIVAAYTHFAANPTQVVVGWSRIGEAVQALKQVLRSVFESSMDGPWSSSQRSSAELAPGEEPAPAMSSMPDDMLDSLIRQCSTAWELRQARSNQSAQPFSCTGPMLQATLALLAKAAKPPLVVAGMEDLAGAAAAFVTKTRRAAAVVQRGQGACALLRTKSIEECSFSSMRKESEA